MSVEILDDGASAMFLKDYGSRLVSDLPGIIKDARKALKDVEYDTLVGRGSSGMLVVPVLAHLLDKHYFIVRKQEEVETSHDSSALFLGTLGRRWVFVDDFISSGETFRRTRDAVREAERVARLPQTNFTWGLPGEAPTETTTTYDFRTELVGYYTYQRDHWHPWTKDARPGFSDFALEDTPAWAGIQERREIRRRRVDIQAMF